MKLVRTMLVAALALSGTSLRADDDAAKPADASTQPSARIGDDARPLVEEMVDAYSKLKSLELAGTISGRFTVEGADPENRSTDFTASFLAPNKFRHEIKRDVLLGCTGQKVYSYKTDDSAYIQTDAPKDKADGKGLPKDVVSVLEMQNPSLMLALSKNPADELKENVVEISKVADTKIDDAACPTLKLDMSDKSSLTLAIDPQTHLLRQSVADLTLVLKQRRADLTLARVTVDYSTIKPDGALADDQFAWAPPAGAKNAEAMAQAHTLGGTQASALEGRPAPTFRLESFDAKKVALADLKGSVVVLDFWASWCGPCRMSLPHLDKLYKEQKDKGVKFFAVNLREEKGGIGLFVQQSKLSVPILMDSDGKVADSYGVEGIPTTVVIAKDGKVRKVFVGFDEDGEAQIRAAIRDAMK